MPQNANLGIGDRVSDKKHAIIQQGTKLIQQVAFILRTTQQVVYQAQVNIHRFYESRDLEEFPLIYVTMASVFVSLKLCDSERRINEVLSCFDRALKVSQGIDRVNLPVLGSSRMSTWRTELRAMESELLRALGFDLFVIHPANYLEPFIDALDLPLPISQSAFAYLNDVGHFQCCIKYHPVILCLAAITLAAHTYTFTLPLPLLPVFSEEYLCYTGYVWPKELLPTGPVNSFDDEVEENDSMFVQKQIVMAMYELHKPVASYSWVEPLRSLPAYKAFQNIEVLEE